MIDWFVTKVDLILYALGGIYFLLSGSDGFAGFTIGFFLAWVVAQFFIYQDKKRREK